MTPYAPATTRPQARRYFAIDLSPLRAERLLPFDLYIAVDGEMALYREKSQAFTEDYRNRLLQSRVHQVYIDESERRQLLGYMELELPMLLKDPGILPDEKASILYATAKIVIEDILENPALRENIRRTEALVEGTIHFLSDDPEAFGILFKQSDQDYKLTSHSVHVGVFALALGRATGIEDASELQALGIGALLHDVGKTRIDTRVMRKRTPLSREEFELMKRHVELGVEVLKESHAIPPMAFIPVLQHQEREDGTGYPGGLSSGEIHAFGKITGVADVFDAMTTGRVYRDAIPSYEALRLMLSMPLDQALVRAFIKLLGPH